MTALRLLADDLTGALDTAAEFARLVGPIRSFWNGSIPRDLPPHVALDSGTRELDRPAALAVMADLVASLVGEGIAYKKVDSLLRGPSLAEVAACMRFGGWRHCIFAPAFPYHGRITQAGRQFAKAPDGGWTAVSDDMVTALRAEGVEAQAGRLDADLPSGISVFDAQADEDLDRIAAMARRANGPLLWSGSGGLADALVRTASDVVEDAAPILRGPILGLFGSDQAATAAQLGACGTHWMVLPDGSTASANLVRQTLSETGIALASFALPAGTARADAAARISAEMDRLVGHLDPPGTLIVAGGETLRSLCLSLGATALDVQGRIVPGLPRSIIRGGRWDDVGVISKSGAFGHPELLRDLLRGADTLSERTI